MFLHSRPASPLWMTSVLYLEPWQKVHPESWSPFPPLHLRFWFWPPIISRDGAKNYTQSGLTPFKVNHTVSASVFRCSIISFLTSCTFWSVSGRVREKKVLICSSTRMVCLDLSASSLSWEIMCRSAEYMLKEIPPWRCGTRQLGSAAARSSSWHASSNKLYSLKKIPRLMCKPGIQTYWYVW